MGPEDVAPIDHCLSCVSCMTTCPSGVDYRRLVDATRVRIHDDYRRPFFDAALRALLVRLLPSPGAFRFSLRLASLGRAFRPVLRRLPGVGPRLDAMLALAPEYLPAPAIGQAPAVFSPGVQAGPRRRMALLAGCAQIVLAPQINAAAIRLLNRAGVEVVIAKGEGCCGSLAHHMGAEARALAQARADIDAWTREIEGDGLEAIVVTASGCGATIKDYGYMLRDDPALCREGAARRGAREGRQRDRRRPRPRICPAAPAGRRLSCGLLAAARAEDRRRAEGPAAPRRLRRALDPRGASLLRLGGHLQHPAARDRQRAARAQGRQYRAREARRDRRRQHRLHRADRIRDRDAGRAYGRTPRLGERRPRAQGAGPVEWRSSAMMQSTTAMLKKRSFPRRVANGLEPDLKLVDRPRWA